MTKTPPVFLHPLSEQKWNTSLTYSNSLKELLQRKISTLEQQLHHSGEDHGHGDEKEHHDRSDHLSSDELDSDGDDNHAGHQDQNHHHDHQEGDGDHENEAEGHSLVAHTGYRAGKAGFHSTKLDSMLNQLHLEGTQTHTFTTEAHAFTTEAHTPLHPK